MMTSYRSSISINAIARSRPPILFDAYTATPTVVSFSLINS